MENKITAAKLPEGLELISIQVWRQSFRWKAGKAVASGEAALWGFHPVTRGRRWLTKRKADRLPLWCASPTPTVGRDIPGPPASAWQQAHSYLLAVNPQGPSVAKTAIKKTPKNITFQHALSLSCPLLSHKTIQFRKHSKNHKQKKANKQIKSSQILSQNKLLVLLHLFLCSFIITFLRQARYIQIKAISSFHA